MKEDIIKILDEFGENPDDKIKIENTFNKILLQFTMFLEFYKVDKDYDWKNNEEDNKSVTLINDIIQKLHDEKYKKKKNEN